MTKRITTDLLIIAIIAIAVFSCKKDDKQPTVPQLTTANITNITPNSATGGGTISSNGGAEITASGICWSSTSEMPTTSDDTTKVSTITGSFTSNLTDLDPSVTYYVRAYAINSMGIGYGSVVTFSTGNAVPEARNVSISGDNGVGEALTATYTYYDFENDPESGTEIQWYVANDTTGATVTPIAGATANTYTLTAGEKDKFIKVGVTAKASAGGSPGTEVQSYWVGPILELVTFTYNGQTVSYGTITSPATGRVWLDRNLGANRVATDPNDTDAWGDLFQWGRGDDGHQLRNSNLTYTLATSETPGHSDFIIGNYNDQVSQGDWLAVANWNRWNENHQGPCPSGWHVPTQEEWEAETGITNLTTAYSQLKLTAGGWRDALFPRIPGNEDPIGGVAQLESGFYWGSTPQYYGLPDPNWDGYELVITPDTYIRRGILRSMGKSVRCIKD